MANPPLVFFCYAQEDLAHLDWIKSSLAHLERDGVATLWHDRSGIPPGANWKLEILKAIDSAAIAVLLVSKHFNNREFIQKEELPRMRANPVLSGRILSLMVRRVETAACGGIEQWQWVNSTDIPFDTMDDDVKEKACIVLANRVKELLAATPATPKMTPEPIFWEPARPRFFVGRTTDLETIANHVQPFRAMCICGMPGVGKSCLAREAAWQFFNRDKRPVIQADCQEQTLDQVLDAIVRQFGEGYLSNLSTQDKESKVRQLLRLQQPLLLVLDQVDLRLLARLEGISEVTSLLAITNRTPVFNWINVLNLEVLDSANSIGLFKHAYVDVLISANSIGRFKQADAAYVADNQVSAIESIVLLLGHLPLAINLCARRARMSNMSPKRMLQELQEIGIVAWDVERILHDSIERNYNELDPKSRRLFSILSLLKGGSFTRENVAIKAAMPDGLLCLDKLIDLSLVSIIADEGYYLHPVIQNFATDSFGLSPSNQDDTQRVVAAYAEFADKHRADFSKLDVERKNFLAILSLCDNSGDKTNYLKIASALLRRDTGQYAYGFLALRGFWKDARRIVDRAAEFAHEAGDRREEAIFFEHKGLLHYWLGDHDSASAAFGKAMEICRDGGDYGEESMILQRQGFICSDEGDYRKCEALYRQSLQIAIERKLPEEMLWTAKHLVGVVLYHRGHYEQSRAWLEEVLEHRSGGAVPVTKRRLAATYRKMGFFPSAEELLIDCLKYKTQDERSTARCLRQLGMLKLATGALGEASAPLRESYDIFYRLGNKQGIGGVLTNLGEWDFRHSQLNEAEGRFKESLRIAGEVKSRYGIGMNKFWLARIEGERRNWLQVTNLAREAIEILESMEYHDMSELCQLHNRALQELEII